MRHTTTAAALLALAVTGGVATVPATAHARQADTARAAWIKACTDRHDTEYPCGPLRLLMSSGRERVVSGAAARAVDRRGRTTSDPARYAVSADGQWLVYERAGDHRLVLRRVSGSPARELPRSLVPKGIGTSDLWVSLSPSGDRVLVEYLEDAGREPSRVLTLATGAITKLPAREESLRFSGDGDEVLSGRILSDNTTRYTAHRLDGSAIRRVPPQAVANSGTLALAADGHTVAALGPGNEQTGAKPRLRLYDLATGELSPAVEVAISPTVSVYSARWSGPDRLTVKTYTGGDGEAVKVRVVTVDVTTGALEQEDRYTIRARVGSWNTAGE
ncbi:hypothetical protein [Nonomuraea sp. NPDC046570]|uniref:hypothetical protein n=1 Tax=Nonomuraea sp. NPDC046570 TaxID=3155255 RepID=UPI003411E79E